MRQLFQKRPSGVFAPADAEAEAWARTVKAGEDVFLEAKRPRNPKHHSKMMALLQFVMESTEGFSNVDGLLLWIKVKVGHYSEHITKDGELVYVPKSISFSSMNQDAFNAFYDKALEVIRAELLPTMTDVEIEAALGFYEDSHW